MVNHIYIYIYIYTHMYSYICTLNLMGVYKYVRIHGNVFYSVTLISTRMKSKHVKNIVWIQYT
jgi:hypothetical protein